MGNKPSSPPPPPTPVTAPRIVQAPPRIESAPVQAAAPVIPVCDAACQREKKLQGLKLALDAATANKVSNPQEYQKARTAYYVELEGQGWLDKERERIGQEEVGPEVTKITDKYKSLLDQQTNQGTFLGLLDVLKSEEEQNKEDLKYIYDQTAQTADKQTLYNRTAELGQVKYNTMNDYFPLIYKVLIGILSLIIIVKIVNVYILPNFSQTPQVAGKRLPH